METGSENKEFQILCLVDDGLDFCSEFYLEQS